MIGGIKIEFKKNKDLIVSEKFFKDLESKLKNASDNLTGYYKFYNNNHKQGLKLELIDSRLVNDLAIWVATNDNSIIVVIDDINSSDSYDCFDDNAFKKAKYFNQEDYDLAIDYAYKVIRRYFKNYFLEEINYRFDMNKCLADIQYIKLDACNFDYDDYHELVTLKNINEGYWCNLIIKEGIMGLRYSKYKDPYCDDYIVISFEEWDPDLNSEINLMISMQKKLNEFIDKQMKYEIRVGNDIEISDLENGKINI